MNKEVHNTSSIRKYKEEISSLQKQLENLTIEHELQSKKFDLYQTVANFAYDWELWILPNMDIHYCSPSCQDITGFTSFEIQQMSNVWSHLVFPPDLNNFLSYLEDIMNFTVLNQSHEFRMLTRTKQIRWSEINCRAIHDSKGKFMGVRSSVRDVTKLKTALGHIEQLTKTNEHEQKIKFRYKVELETTERELTSLLLLVSNKNSLISYIKSKLQIIKPSVNKVTQIAIADLQHRIVGSLLLSNEWKAFKTHFENIHPGFFDRLSSSFPLLTHKDMILLAYLRLNLSSKEIAGLISITPASVEIARVRLRKKLNLNRNVRLTTYVRNI